jgi:hypothetical protein
VTMTGSSSGSPMMRSTPTELADLGEASEMVGSAWEVEHRHDSELTRRLGFQSLRIKIHRRMGTIYRAFLHRIIEGNDSNTFLV